MSSDTEDLDANTGGGLVRGGLATSLTGVCEEDPSKLQDMGREVLPRTLSTSVLRIKNRTSFWDKFWRERRQTDS